MRKLCIGQASWFCWTPPSTGDIPSGDVTLTVRWPSGDVVYTLTAPGACTVISVDGTDRTALSVEWPDDGAPGPDPPPSPVPPAGWREWYPAPVLISRGAETQVPATVVRAVLTEDGDTGDLIMSEPLPAGVVADASVRWLVYAVEIPAEDIPATPARPVLWSVSYTASRWGLAHGTVVDRGALAVVRAPFATGLTDAGLAAQFPSLVPAAGQTTFAPQIEAALWILVSRIEQSLSAGVHADQLAGGQFLRAHVLQTVVLLCDDLMARGVDRSALRDRCMADLDAELSRALARPEMLDADDDGTADAAGTPASVSIPALSHVTGAAVCSFPMDADVELTRDGVGDER